MRKKVNSRPTVMFLEWATEGRELEMLLPIMHCFEKILNWNILYKSQFNAPSVHLCKVNLIITSGINGSNLAVVWAKRIKKLGIPLITQITEGIFGEIDIKEEVWGHNIKQLDLETRRFLWSNKSLKLTKKYFPEFAEKSFVSGSIGFDKYKILKNKKHYQKKVIGFGSLDFLRVIDAYQNNFLYSDFKHLIPKIRDALDRTLKTLKYLSEKNPDKIILIKPHPGDLTYKDIFSKIRKNKNVIILESTDKIKDAIYNSDIWITFSSTTVIDAWCLNKPTIQLTKDSDLTAGNFVSGGIMEESKEKIQSYVDEFFINDKIEKFDKLSNKREKIIQDTVGFIDGFNHLRLILQSQDIIKNSINKKITIKLELKVLISGFFRHLIYSISKLNLPITFFKNRSHIYKRWNMKKMELEKVKFYSDADFFYSQNKQNIINIIKLYSHNNCKSISNVFKSYLKKNIN